MSRGIKSKDLAQMLGVSPSTVSMVLNNKPGISEATRKLVLDKIAELNSQTSEMPGVVPSNGFIYFIIYKKHGKVVGDTPFFSQLIEGIESTVKANGSSLQIAYYNQGSDLSLSLPLLYSKECKGVILLATEMSLTDVQNFAHLGKPIVLLDSYFDELPLDTIVINNSQAARCAARFLIENGHKKIGYLHSAFHINNFSERKDGFYRELRRKNIEVRTDLEYKLTPTAEGAYADMKELLENHSEMPTAFFADNDIIALSAIRALKEFGYRIPDDISVIGIDDMPMCELMDPPLTTMQVPKHEMGIMAVKRLSDVIHDRGREIVTLQLRTSLIRRNSVKNII